MAEILKTTGERIPVEPRNGRNFKLEQMQEIVGGWIEIVNLPDGKILVINDEGLNLNLPRNAAATTLYGYGPIVGDVILCESRQVK